MVRRDDGPSIMQGSVFGGDSSSYTIRNSNPAHELLTTLEDTLQRNVERIPMLLACVSLTKRLVNGVNAALKDYTLLIIYLLAAAGIILACAPLYLTTPLDNLVNEPIHDAFYSNIFQITAIASVACTWTGFIDCFLDLLSGTATATDVCERFILLLCLIIPGGFAVICNQFNLAKDCAVAIFSVLNVCYNILFLAPMVVGTFKRGGSTFSPLLVISFYALYVLVCVLRNVSSVSLQNIGVGIAYLLYAAFFLLSAWFWLHLYHVSKKSKAKSNEIHVGVSLLCLLIFRLSLIVHQSSGALSVSDGGTPTILSTDVFFRIIYTLAATVLPERLAKLLHTESIKKLDMKSLFVRYVSHEIRTPLNIACVGLDVLMRLRQSRRFSGEVNPALDAEDEDLIEQIKDSCKVAVTILDDLLAYEKLDSGLLALDKSDVNVARFIKDTAALFNIQIRGKNLKCLVLENTDRFDDALTCEMDPGKMAQVLRNFISNAIKFTPEGGSIRVNSFIRAERAMPMLVIHVIDSGVGLGPEQLNKIFKEIIQFNANALQSGGGSGLGLWVSKKIVDLHEGTVKVSSDGPGHGCVFEIALPLRSAQRPNAAYTGNRSRRIAPVKSEVPSHHTELRPQRSLGVLSMFSRSVGSNGAMNSNSRSRGEDLTQAEHADFRGMHCLVVDDSKINRKMMSRLLATCGITVNEADDGLDCVEMVKRQLEQAWGKHIDIILMDNQ